MEVSKELKEVMTRYLLGKATPVEQEALEDRYAADPEVFEQLIAVENDLADRYARHQLSTSEQKAFERHVLSHPRRRARVQFAEAFLQQLDEPVVPIAPVSFGKRLTSWWRELNDSWSVTLGFVTATLLLVMGSWWLLSKFATFVPFNVAQQSSTPVLPTPVPSASPLTSPINTGTSPVTSPLPTVSPSAPALLAFTLVGATTRNAADIQSLLIPNNTKQVRLRMNLEDEDYLQYKIQLRTASGTDVLTQTKLKPAANKKFATITIPSKLLTSGDYFLVLSGLGKSEEAEDLTTFMFRVHRQ